MCLGHFAGRGRSFGRQLLNYIEVPGRLVAIDLRLGEVAGKGELFLMCAAALHALVAGFGCPQRGRRGCQLSPGIGVIQGYQQLAGVHLLAHVNVHILDGRCFRRVCLKDVLRLDPAAGAAGLDQILHLGLGDPQRQFFPRHPADTEENENESDRGSNPERTAADSFSSCFYHSIATGGQYIRRVAISPGVMVL